MIGSTRLFVLRWWIVGFLVPAVSCGGPGEGVGIGDIRGDAPGSDAGALPDGSRVDTSRGEVDGASRIDGTVGDGAGDADVVSAGLFGDPCQDNGDCASGYCVAYLGEKVCTEQCIEECPQGWKCIQLQTGREPVWVCMSDFAHLCLPCTKSSDCVFGGVGGVSCVSYGPKGAFCGTACAEDADCPAGFACLDATTTEGAEVRQCKVPDGLCPCGSLAEELGLVALCFVENDWGICTGERVCVEGELTACDASVPAKEVCNQADDDCDGVADEEINNCCVCGDGICHNFCESLETCSPDCAACGDGICSPGESPCTCEHDCCGTCGDGKCASYVVEGQQCCTESLESCPEDCQTSTCGNGDCESGEHPLNCPQDCELFFCGNHMCEPGEEPGGEKDCPQDCTEFCGNCVCEPDESFITCPMDCGFCGDGVCSLCTGMGEWDADNDTWICAADCCNPADVCQPDGLPPKECGPNGCGGVCGNCDDANPCTEDVCLGTGYCQHTAVADDTPCDDGGKCIGLCQEGVCIETAVEVCDNIDNDCDGEVDEGFIDSDFDGMADCIDFDDDNDGVFDDMDNCPMDPNPDQANHDLDLDGDVCDPDDDNDGAPDETDCLPFDPAAWAPDCDGKDCGPDGCGGSCGSCPAFPNYFCQDGVCQCTPDDCGFLGHECGDWPDGCGGTAACGGCPAQHICDSNGTCKCVPDCLGKECGSDGCGGICGTCAPNETCTNGQCESEIVTVSHWWRADECGKYHTAYIENGTCYYATTSNPLGNWNAPVSIGPCETMAIETDRGNTCHAHMAYNTSQGTKLNYCEWNGSTITNAFTVTSSAWGNGLYLDQNDRPHLFWSTSRAYHRSRNSDLSWNPTSEISNGAPSGWNPVISMDSSGVFRSSFRRASPPPSTNAVTYLSHSTDNGQTWEGLSQLFPEFGDNVWYFWRLSCFSGHMSDYRFLLADSNKSGDNDLWSTETAGVSWSTPVLWRPLLPYIKVLLKGGAINPSNGKLLVLIFSEYVNESSWYTQFKCISGNSYEAVPWPSITGNGPTTGFITWEKDELPRLFWKENENSSSWYTATLVPPTC